MDLQEVMETFKPKVEWRGYDRGFWIATFVLSKGGITTQQFKNLNEMISWTEKKKSQLSTNH